jgi:hypothetical protein
MAHVVPRGSEYFQFRVLVFGLDVASFARGLALDELCESSFLRAICVNRVEGSARNLLPLLSGLVLCLSPPMFRVLAAEAVRSPRLAPKILPCITAERAIWMSYLGQ